MNRIVGPKPSNRFCHHGAPVSSGWALTTTPFRWSSSDRASLSANAGISVWKRVVGFDPAYCSFWRERALDRRALRRDLLDVARAHLIEEERAVRNADAGRRLRRPRAEVEVEGQQREGEEDPAAGRTKAGRLRRCRRRPRRSARAGGGLALLLILARCHHRSGLTIATNQD